MPHMWPALQLPTGDTTPASTDEVDEFETDGVETEASVADTFIPPELGSAPSDSTTPDFTASPTSIEEVEMGEEIEMGEQGEEIEPEGVDEVETSEVEKPVDEQGEAVEMGETVEQE